MPKIISKSVRLTIFIKKDKIGRLVFPSWPFGVPVYIGKKTKKVAVNPLNPSWPAPYIGRHPKNFELVSSKDYMEAFTRNHEKFIEAYSLPNTKEKKNIIDLAQVRLVIDPSSYIDSSTVKTVCYTRNRISPATLNRYCKELYALIIEDVGLFAKKPVLEESNPLSRLINYLRGKK